jgi:hypothetical protein
MDDVSKSRDERALQQVHVGGASAHVCGEEDGKALAHGVVGLVAREVQQQQRKQHLCNRPCACFFLGALEFVLVG